MYPVSTEETANALGTLIDGVEVKISLGVGNGALVDRQTRGCVQRNCEHMDIISY